MTDIRRDDPYATARWWNGPVDPPRICVWELTLACDLGCRHCGSRAGKARHDELTTAEALRTVGELADLGVREVTLIGGEAYLRDDWAEIARAVTDAGMICTMVTGGFDFDAFRIQEALAGGVARIGVSIDGIGPTHDRLRGRIGSFEAAIAAAERIKATDQIGLSINTQINRLSLPELEEIAHRIVALGADHWQVQLTVALGRAADRPDLLLQPFHMLAVMPLLDRIKRTILDPGGVQLVPGNNVGYFGRYESLLRFGGEQGHVWSGCKAGQAALGLEADGGLKGCPSLPSEAYRGGTVRDTPVGTLWRESSTIRKLGERTRQDLWGHCAQCDHADRCMGGCTWTSHALFGRPGNNPFCYHRAETLAAQGLRERISLVTAAPGRPFDHGMFSLTEEASDAPLAAGEDLVAALALRRLASPAQGAGAWSESAVRRATMRTKVARGAEPVA